MLDFHKSVMVDKVIEFLKVEKGKFYIDCTLGDGGYSLEIIKRGGIVLGIDVDEEAIGRTKKRFEQLSIEKKKYKLIRGNFKGLENYVDFKVDGVVFDLGVSSYQLDSATRGFSFNKDGPLDMRMDKNLNVQAADLLNALNKGELNLLFSRYGEIGDSRIVNGILSLREKKPFSSTKELADLIEKIRGRHKKIHPATQFFQALRIAVNDELNNLSAGLNCGIRVLNKEGRMVVVSFHSLEDRIVKESFKAFEERKLGLSLTDGVILPSNSEIKINPRSRSAKLRAFIEYV